MLQLSFVNFKQNSYILVEGTPPRDSFYIIQSGKVKSYNEAQIPGSSTAILGPGDFIGVISCMSGHSQTETVVALTNVVVIVVKKEQYPELIMKNTPVAMKIVKSFAQKMRVLNDNLTKITVKKTNIETAEHIFEIAEYYDDNDMRDIAIYAYYQYIRACPSGANVMTAKKRYSELKNKTTAVYFEPVPEAVRNYPKNTMIFSESQSGSDMYIIQEGSVRISKVVDGCEVTLAILKKGDMFGEMALLENKPRSASAIAHEPCRLMTINGKNFNQMVQTQSQMISKLTTILSDRLWSMYRQLANTQLRDPREKMIDMLALQLEKQKGTYLKATAFSTDFSPEDIVNLCGIPQQEMNLSIYQLSTDQNVKYSSDGKIIVPDVPELIKQAAFYRKQNNRRANEL